MKLKRAAWVLVLTPLAALVAMATPSCSSSSTPLAGLAAGCSLNTDCDSPLVCIFALCHQQCSATRDCTGGAACVETPSGYGVCQLASEANCSPTQPCANDFKCGLDLQCRAPCTTVSNCLANQQCTEGACYDPGELDGSALGDGSTGGDTGSSSGGNNEGGGDAPHDGSTVDAGPLGFVPSNFGTLSIADGGVPEAGEGGTSVVQSDGGLDFTDAPNVTVSGTCTTTCLPPRVVISLGTNPPTFADVYVMKTLTVSSSATLSFNDTNPVILAVLGEVEVEGEINVGAAGATGTAGATTWASPVGPQGLGGGANGFSGNYPASGGGGGSFCGVGGAGGATSGNAAIGGGVYGSATLTPLFAGSAGGNADGNAWGAGGGGLQISSGSDIHVFAVGIINAGGGAYFGGGGSGGAILLEAPTIEIDGNVTANGGGGGGFSTKTTSGLGTNAQTDGQPAPGGMTNGVIVGGAGSAGTTITGSPGTTGDAGAANGSGGGGAGWIRLNTTSGAASVSGTVSPALSTPCATQGTLG